MKKVVLLLAVAVILPAHAEDLAPALRSCSSFTDAKDFIDSTASAHKPHVIDGMSYFKPRRGLTFDGLPVLSVFGFDADRRMFPGSPVGTQPPRSYGVSLEGTAASGSRLAANSSAHASASPLTVSGHEFVDIGCYSR